MAHPYQKHREGAASKARVQHILKADGGAIDNSIDLSTNPDKEGPYSLGQTMSYERAKQDSDEVLQGKRFFDGGTRIPGRQKAKNDAYDAKLNKRN